MEKEKGEKNEKRPPMVDQTTETEKKVESKATQTEEREEEKEKEVSTEVMDEQQGDQKKVEVEKPSDEAVAPEVIETVSTLSKKATEPGDRIRKPQRDPGRPRINFFLKKKRRVPREVMKIVRAGSCSSDLPNKASASSDASSKRFLPPAFVVREEFAVEAVEEDAVLKRSDPSSRTARPKRKSPKKKTRKKSQVSDAESSSPSPKRRRSEKDKPIAAKGAIRSVPENEQPAKIEEVKTSPSNSGHRPAKVATKAKEESIPSSAARISLRKSQTTKTTFVSQSLVNQVPGDLIPLGNPSKKDEEPRKRLDLKTIKEKLEQKQQDVAKRSPLPMKATRPFGRLPPSLLQASADSPSPKRTTTQPKLRLKYKREQQEVSLPRLDHQDLVGTNLEQEIPATPPGDAASEPAAEVAPVVNPSNCDDPKSVTEANLVQGGEEKFDGNEPTVEDHKASNEIEEMSEGEAVETPSEAVNDNEMEVDKQKHEESAAEEQVVLSQTGAEGRPYLGLLKEKFVRQNDVRNLRVRSKKTAIVARKDISREVSLSLVRTQIGRLKQKLSKEDVLNVVKHLSKPEFAGPYERILLDCLSSVCVAFDSTFFSVSVV